MSPVAALSLDGGAFLVLSELFILREIMARLGNVLNLETMPLPSDHFDLIGGAGAGGILAILLGRLRMSVDAVIEHFIRLYQALYQSGLDKTGRSLKLAEYFQNLVQDVTMAESKPSCNVFVCAMPAVAVTGSKPSLFRNYVARRFASFDCKIWEAARATTADHSHFEVISIGPTWSPEEYVDPGAFGLSNPIDSVVEEAKSLFPSGQEMLLLSLGAGHPGVFSFHANSDELVPLHKTISEDCERTAHRMEGREYEGYFRFNVAQGFQGIGLLELTKPGIIAGHTKQYLHSVDVDHRVDNVVSFLEKRHRQSSSRTLTQDDTSTATLLPQVAPLPQEHLTTFFSSPSIVPFTTAQPIQAYMYELYEAGHGLPLWDPEPFNGTKPVEIGDVGIITEDGGFETLFNATVVAGSQVSAGVRLPSGFEPLVVDDSDLLIRQGAIHPPYVMHGNIELRRQGLEDFAEPSIQSGQSDFSLCLKTTRGAALIFKDPPTRITLRPSHKIFDYISRHYRSWYHFYETDPDGPRRILDGTALVFVTGIYQNSSWALGAWANQDVQSVATYSGSATVLSGSVTSLSGKWSPALTHNVKQGPQRTNVGPIRLLRSERQVSGDLSCHPADQTLFVRGYTIGRKIRDLDPSHVYPHPTWLQNVLKLISLGIPPVLRAAAQHRDLSPPPPPPSMSPPVPVSLETEDDEVEDVGIHEIFFGKPPQHPAKDVIDTLFKACPESEAIVVHDDDIESLIQYSQSLDLQNSLTGEQAAKLVSLSPGEQSTLAMKLLVNPVLQPNGPEAVLVSSPDSINSYLHHIRDISCHAETLEAVEKSVLYQRQLMHERPKLTDADLAHSLTNLSIRLSESGRHTEALAVIEEAVLLRRRLMVDCPEIFKVKLVLSLTNSSNCLSNVGRPAEALAAIDEAVSLYRQLVQESSKTSEANLALLLTNFSNRLSNVGRHAEALSAIEEAVLLQRKLMQERPQIFAADLARSLTNCSNRLSDAGYHDKALAAIGEAVSLQRQLVQKHPKVYEAKLVLSLTNFSNRLSDSGRHVEALAAIEEAVSLYRQLVQERPEAFEANLALSLTNFSNCLSDAGRHEEALDAVGEAVSLYRQLVQERPKVFEANLALSLTNFSNRLSDAGYHERALTAIGEAVSLQRQLMQERPKVLESNLALSLTNYSNCLSDAGRHSEALAAIEEAVSLRRQLVREHPKVFEAKLALSLANLSNRLSDVGRHIEALAAIEEAISLRRRLVLERPRVFEASLAHSLANFSHCLSKAGRLADALAAIEEAVMLSQQFGHEKPKTYKMYLKGAIQKMAQMQFRRFDI